MIVMFAGTGHSVIAPASSRSSSERGGGLTAAAALRGVLAAHAARAVSLALLHIRSLRVPQLCLQSARW